MKLSIDMVGGEESLFPGRLRKVEPAEARICEQVKDLMFSSHGIALVNRRWQAARPIQLDHRLFRFFQLLSDFRSSAVGESIAGAWTPELSMMINGSFYCRRTRGKKTMVNEIIKH